jgi:hypothetical protein
MTATNLLAAEIVVDYMHGTLPHPDCIVAQPRQAHDRVGTEPYPSARH